MEKVSSKAVHANHFWVCFTMIIFFGVNLIFNFILFRGNYRQNKEYAATGKQFPVAFLIMVFIPKTKWFWVYFCYGGVIGILLGKCLSSSMKYE